MSDCFDHGMDAYESRFSCNDRGPTYYPSNPLHYHTKITITNLLKMTEKSYLFVFENGEELWVPKKVCRNLDLLEKTVYIHRLTLSKLRR